MSKAYTYRAKFMVSRLDGADVKEVVVGETVKANDEIDVEAICHLNFIDKSLPSLIGYKVLNLPTVSNGRLSIHVASDYGW